LPAFLAAALKDLIGADRDRIQIVKHWVHKDGTVQERIHDAAMSGARKIDTDGRGRTSVEDTVDAANTTWTNTIGAPELITWLKDPDFDPRLRVLLRPRH
jgi:hypothetical protein